MGAVYRPGPAVRWPRTVFVGSYPPRECGIATFTRDLVAAVDRRNPSTPGHIIAMNDPGRTYNYPPSVKWQIERDQPGSYDDAAAFVNDSRTAVVNVQHEYGLFGGVWGDHLFRFLDRVERPVVLTMHTSLPNPDATLREVTRGLVERSQATIVLARTAMDILVRDYGIDRGRLHFVPHGVPNIRPISSSAAKRALGLGDRPTLVTCGLMNPGKGIEYAIDALSGLVGEFPDVAYLVAGETHPGVRAQSGESYREQLQAQVRRLGLQDHVIFKNRYLTYRELVLHLLASDVYVVPYLDLNQIVSGTLAYAVGCGRAVVSTPSAFAREILAEGRGLLAEARNPIALQARISAVLRNPDYKQQLQARAYAYGHNMIWPNVARDYLETFQAVCDDQAHRTVALVRPLERRVAMEVLSA